ncbi:MULTISPECIES: hypothetical protein [Cyanophyceae]|uniref:hypothetical protein n=1 Tax=Cyanophyceae TaxID=3028117 RepID=UPI001686C8AE|nr:hypothetical protein [Trichocoleus sp. FACHB-40]MBD2004507.1 hypothetical protein [Trichocoleus sp. FACHB-40]
MVIVPVSILSDRSHCSLSTSRVRDRFHVPTPDKLWSDLLRWTLNDSHHPRSRYKGAN